MNPFVRNHDDLPVVTLALIGLSIAATLYAGFGSNRGHVYALLITEYANAGLPEIRDGQLWRLITPIFLHFAWYHLAFDALWMWQLGSVIERRMGPGHLLLLVLVIGIGSNLTQFVGVGPAFGGLSGVVYGLLAYFWVQGRFNPRFGLVLYNNVVYLMLIWFVLCWVHVIPNVANWAHTGGLAIGLAAGWVSWKLGRP
jgi:GlpG protein